MKHLFLFFALILFSTLYTSAQSSKPLKVAVAGLTHDHVGWILRRAADKDIELIGIAEPNKALAERRLKQYNLDMSLWYPTLDEMLANVSPEAVCAFNSIYEHLEVVQKCAPRGIHVMVEKPLAVNPEHAREMQQLAEKHSIHLLTNYETSWYATSNKTFEMTRENSEIGPLRKIVVHDGHKGPREIGCSEEFLAWLTDPVLNGGGALIDFGCYGANLVTWLMNGERPISVSAVTQQIKPDIYPRVDDEATIILTYPSSQAIIQASWNWPISRKDMQVYGKNGYIYTENGLKMRYRNNEKQPEQPLTLEKPSSPHDDPFSYLKAVVRGEIKVPEYGTGSLENNMIVVEILDAARRSAASGKAVVLEKNK